MLSVQWLFFAGLAFGQSFQPLARKQNNTWNSSFTLSADQLERYSLTKEQARNINVATRAEQTNYAFGPVAGDDFYTAPANSSGAAPGSLLKVERFTNTSAYTLPAGVALSRFIYQSENFNGSSVPVSAYVLWPWQGRKFDNISGVPVVAWAHGTSGFVPDCGPSHYRNLQHQFTAPFALAQQGYAVVATDYAGLGVGHDADGNPVPHQYNFPLAGANDVVYAVQAAREAWPALSKEYVVFGHSAGGSVSWWTAIAHSKAAGYLGSIAAAPGTSFNFTQQALGIAFDPFIPALAANLASVFPAFNLSDWLTPNGIRAVELTRETGGCLVSFLETALLGFSALPNTLGTWAGLAFDAATTVITHEVAAPLLVLQGTADSTVGAGATDRAVDIVCDDYPASPLEYRTLEGVSHTGVLFAGQRLWLAWIEDRFRGAAVPPGCHSVHEEPLQPVDDYAEYNSYYMGLVRYGYQALT